MNFIYDFLLENGIIKESKEQQISLVEPYYHILYKENLPKEVFSARDRFAHKGCFGHALLIAGSYGKVGAAVLSAKATLRAGCGLLSVHICKKLYDIMQISVPEAMIDLDESDTMFSTLTDAEKFSAIGIGPGLGTNIKTKSVLQEFLQANRKPVVLDADALNILSTIKDFHKILTENTILTPHPKEFERLFGKFTSYKQKIEFMRRFCSQYGVIIVLKGGITAISDASGDIYFNIIGNAGMATAGSGDVLSGIVLGMLSQKFSSISSAQSAVYVHALAGDLAKMEMGEKSLIASDIINFLPKAFNKIGER